MTYKDLHVYQKSTDFVVEIYKLTKSFPESEKFGIISQLQRAVVSIPANIAEGSQRQSSADYVRFLYFSYGSCAEVETFLLVSLKLHYMAEEKYNELSASLIEISKMLRGLILKIKEK